MALRTLDSLGSLAGKRVVVRCDLNVPLKDGVITDDGRVRASLPTLNALIDQGARVVVCSHLGRPKGQRSADLELGARTRLPGDPPEAERDVEVELPILDSTFIRPLPIALV